MLQIDRDRMSFPLLLMPHNCIVCAYEYRTAPSHTICLRDCTICISVRCQFGNTDSKLRIEEKHAIWIERQALLGGLVSKENR
jgi:hypothetical protein